MNKFLTLLLIAGSIFFTACSDDEGTDVRAENEAAIQEYLMQNNIIAQSSGSGLYWVVETEGNGTFPSIADRVSVTYRGYRIDGSTFETAANPVTFDLISLIPGWQEGIPKLSEGGSGVLFIPAHLAYGERSPSNNGVIIFDISLVDVL